MSKKANKNEVAPQAGDKTFSSLADLTPDPQNARKHNPRNVGMLVDSLHQVGAARSIVVDENGVVLAGNATIEAAAEAGIHRVKTVEADGSEIVAVVRRGLSKEQKTKLALYDNRVAELAEWNPEILAELTDTKELEGMFSDKELAEILTQTGAESKDAEPQIDKAEELRQKWGTETGQLWVIGNHRLLVGDATNKADVGRLCAEHGIDLVMADPPYGIKADRMTMGDKESSKPRALRLSTGQNWDAERPELRELPTAGKHCCIWGGQYFCHQLPISDDWLCWHKKIAGVSFAEAELAWTNYGTRMRVFAHHWSGEEKLHITQKPLEVIVWAISMCPDDPRSIYDPFVGSGTTLVAAENLNRKCYAMEISPAYVAVCLERMSRAFPHLKIEKVDQARAA